MLTGGASRFHTSIIKCIFSKMLLVPGQSIAGIASAMAVILGVCIMIVCKLSSLNCYARKTRGIYDE